MSMLRQVGVQILGVVSVVLWCGGLTYLILKVLQGTIGLRVSENQEREGLDLSQHGERAYNE